MKKIRLSHSSIATFLDCPERYYLRYKDGWRNTTPNASLIFGSAVHKALEHYFRNGINPVVAFIQEWGKNETKEMYYSARDNWETLNEKGRNLLTLFLSDYAHRFTDVVETEGELRVEIEEGLGILGYYDLLCSVDGVPSIVDFKTAAQRYDPRTVETSDQLTLYLALARRLKMEPKQVVFVVLVKNKKPVIQILVGKRKVKDTVGIIRRAKTVRDLIVAGVRYKNCGRCLDYGGCDMYPVCYNDAKRIEKELVQETRRWRR